MVSCKFCNQDNLEWYQTSDERWKLGLKTDINNYMPHKCSPPQIEKKSNNSRNWVNFRCGKCASDVKQNIKLIKSTTLNYCLDCLNQC